MHYDTLILNGLLVTPERVESADIAVRDGKIAAIGDFKQSDANAVIDAKGLHVFPGVIDTQVHFREPGLEHKEDLESGTRAAVCGGVTTIFEMPNTSPTTTTPEALWDKLHRAHGRAWCNYAFFVGAAKDNIDLLAELEMAPGSPGIKIFMGSSTGPLLVDGEENLRQVLLNGTRRCPIHAEDEERLRHRKLEYERGEAHWGDGARAHPQIRDPEAARLATHRILRLSRATGRPVHILHVSTADELSLIREAKAEGIGTTAEITPQHLWFHAPDCYERLGTFAQMNPPIRDATHQAALRQAVSDGLFDVVGSDHAPHTLEEKQRDYPHSPSGMPGVQTLLSVMISLAKDTGLLDLMAIARLCSYAPAEIYGVQNKGRIEEGYDADLALVDVERRFTVEQSWLQSKCGWSPYEGEELAGFPTGTMIQGNWALRDGAIQGLPSGQMVRFDWKPKS